MSVHADIKRITVPQLMAYKGQKKIVSLTSYIAPFARIIDEYVDMILIGDSTAMVGYNMDDTLSITVDQLAAHAKAVVSSTQRACIVVDMPFGSYQESPEQAFRNAAKMLSASGADAVKFEGGEYLAETTRFLVDRGIPVLAHIGLMPQYVNTMGGFKAQGLSEEAANRIFNDAIAQEQAGAWGIVIEGTAEPLARRITQSVKIPTIGIGASPECDGQVLVAEDIFNLSGSRIPKFAQQFSDVQAAIRQGVEAYSSQVRDGSFPTLNHCFGVAKNG
ncbi:3-methyl-2-oxobutanoate hydroxymethyltransferase [Advenella alkanexedens]|jgi:3-methyl-2-oxobutanoate hydroxymethyltransferase|uniref:3-methyl-2-oxobutanoate hydroxymethyltransferase n=1 Tax=Advenella alkanexedens TaxID=1481665 RepID=A0ABS6NM20_9BURK|nr:MULTISPECIES: 3-methyl-2-oxobutanoate hydroxymethyltransferase [Advenella]MBV4396668.1 3-methyl-2-oxobutanoate hydroxymethyltransferase [Advenella alkanexedens]MDD3758326.1 3-methyl-2-oxobutanoate hydroxymethyltransferase [Advenella sp.]NLN66573.1 3-methyl-2-oxobutanoate hydroxymethyltransferase [Alcaligenaceae bacterium]